MTSYDTDVQALANQVNLDLTKVGIFEKLTSLRASSLFSEEEGEEDMTTL
jgi:hypothetical protein